MRTISTTLKDAGLANHRYPLARVTVRNTLMDWDFFAITPSNPFGLPGDEVTTLGERFCYGDSLATQAGTILRAYTGTVGLHVQRVVTPSTASNWTVAWTNLATTTQNYCNPGLIQATNGTIYLYYASGQFLNFKTSVDDGVTWSAPTVAVLLNLAFGSSSYTIAPVAVSATTAELYVCSIYGWAVRVERVVLAGGVWSTSEMPRRIYGTTTFPPLATGAGFYSTTFFDAVPLPDTDGLAKGGALIIYSQGNTNRHYAVSCYQGNWGDPRPIFPDEYTKFYPCRASIINGKIVLTARIKRDNQNGYSPEMEVLLHSPNGVDWTALDRDSFIEFGLPITATEIKGKIHQVGNYLYCVGMVRVYRTDTTTILDETGDNATRKLVVPSADVLEITHNSPGTGTSPSGTLALANGDGTYLNHAIVKKGSEVQIELGYKTTAGDEYVTVLQGVIGGVERATSAGQETLRLDLRDRLFTRLKDYKSPVYRALNSQLKHFDPCDLMDSLYVVHGDSWIAMAANMAGGNTGFEAPLYNAEWSQYDTGATGTYGFNPDQYYSGSYSMRISKTGGATTANFGVSRSLPAVLKDTAYTIEVKIHITAIAGGAKTIRLEAGGNWGVAGAAASVVVDQTDVTTEWATLSTGFTPSVDSATGNYVRIFFDDASTGTCYIDDLSLIPNVSGTLNYSSQTVDGIAFSTSPNETEDFDISAKVSFRGTVTAESSSVGLIGLGVDNKNFLVFRITKGTTNNLLFQRCRDGIYTSIAIASATVSVNVNYRMRFVHTGGKFRCYLTTDATTLMNWGLPKITQDWVDSTLPGGQSLQLICPSDNGKGKVGVFARIAPLNFYSYGLDKMSNTIALRVYGDSRWSEVPSSGYVQIEDEEIYYGAKTTYSNVPDMNDTGFAWAAERLPGEVWFPQAIEGYDHRVDLKVTTPTNPNDEVFGYKNYAVTFPECAIPGITYRIDLTTYALPGQNIEYPAGATLRVHCASNIPDVAESPSRRIFGDPETMTANIAPCLYNCVRGWGDTSPVAHPDQALAFTFCDEFVQLESFMALDYVPDENIESVLTRTTYMAGARLPTFGSAYSLTSSTSTSAIQAASLTRKDFTAHFTSAPIATGNWVSLRFRANSNSTGLVMRIENTSGTYYCRLYQNTDFTNYVESHTLPTDIIGASSFVLIRVVATGNFITVYVNNAHAATFYTTLFNASALNYIYFQQATGTLYNLRVPELDMRRDGFSIDNDVAGLQLIGNAIQDRPIKYFSKSGGSLYFSVFDTRDVLNTLTTTTLRDSDSENITEAVSFLRIYADEIVEVMDPGLMADYGFVMGIRQMSRSTAAQAADMATRMFREIKESIETHGMEVGAILNIENEDKVVISYTLVATSRAVLKTVIVNGYDFTFSPGNLSLTIGSRKFIS